MAYKCLECGHIFEEGEQAIWEEHHPYGMGYAAESFVCCPICKGAFKETVKCQICGGEFLPEELNSNYICDECINEFKKNFDICYSISKGEKEKIEIKALLVSLFDVCEIEKILYQHIKNTKSDIDCSSFIEQDKEWFCYKLIEEVKK